MVGGGYAGLATAGRLAKTGHDVTLLERAATLVENLGGSARQ